MLRRPLLFIAVLAALAACDTPVEGQDPVPPERPATGPLTPAGPAETLSADPDENLQWAAAVVRIDELERQGDLTAKLFGTAGGDPAMNGLYSYVAFFVSPGDGWRVFRIGDFLDYRVLSTSTGRVELEITESTMDPGTGEIGSRTRRVILGWAAGPDGAPPGTVTVTPAA